MINKKILLLLTGTLTVPGIIGLTGCGRSASTEEAGINFYDVFDDCGLDSSYADVGSSYLSIDTNPNDIDDYIDYSATSSLYTINAHLGLPDYLTEDMGSTRAIDGRQTETFDDAGISVSWSYHPDNGLEVIYKSLQ